MRKFLTTTLFIVFCLSLKAQSAELGVNGGLSFYSGDISPQEFGIYFKDFNPAIGFFGRLNFGQTFSARLGLNFTKVSGDDMEIGREDRGLNFRSQIVEVALTGELNLLHLGSKKGLQVVPFIFGGGGIFHFNPEGRLEDNWVELQPLGTEGQGLEGYEEPYALTQFNILGGGGFKFIINDSWTIGFEMGGRKLFTDHLDDVSNANVDYFDVLEGNGDLAAHFSNPTVKNPEEGDISYRRGGKFDDWYYISSLTLSFRIGNSNNYYGGGGRNRNIGCPTF
ncbi:MAG: hypothetical protein DHS20C18_51690 [Saprospiraceae bacterium]|nr:MAG: hypothetical protein DHS20C18_51690 [Saprospiraceae bacterium]